MALHAHEYHQISFLVCGTLIEKSKLHATSVMTLRTCVKPAGYEHSNSYGSMGCLVFAVNLPPEVNIKTFLCPNMFGQWSAELSHSEHRRFVHSVDEIVSGSRQDAAQRVSEIVSIACQAEQQSVYFKPLWLSEAIDKLIGDPNQCLKKLAISLDIHPVYMSRAFNKYMGCTLSAFKSRMRYAIALENLVGGSSILRAASNAGYADQAHFTRDSRRLLGITPGILASLLSS